ncbi:MAG: hypothetical protein ABUL60_03145 [Myxococcales bacterium]
MEATDDYTRYRAAWIAIFRRQAVAKALRLAVLVAVVLSLLHLVPRAALGLLALGLALISLATQLLIRCPRCRAWWPLGSDDDGQRNPCAQCGLRWGQEDELPDA